jgi:crossover junction endodeoxyribonuclease RuvC
MRIIGIDPGTATTGFSIIDYDRKKMKLLDFGCIKTKSTSPMGARLNQISKDLTTLIKKYKPQKASIENLFFNKNVKTAITVAQARGVIIQTLEKHKIPQKEYTPGQIKLAVCGHGRADKKAVQQMLKVIFGLKNPPKPDDAADAIAAAICTANHIEL